VQLNVREVAARRGGPRRCSVARSGGGVRGSGRAPRQYLCALRARRVRRDLRPARLAHDCARQSRQRARGNGAGARRPSLDQPAGLRPPE